MSLVQFSSVAQSCPTLRDPMNRSTPGLPVHHQLRSLRELMSIHSVMPSNHLILFYPLLLLSSVFPSISVFSNESVLHIRWPNYWSFSFSISPANEQPGLISFRMDQLDLLAVQGTQESSPTSQFKSLNLLASAFSTYEKHFFFQLGCQQSIYLDFPDGSVGKESACNAGGIGDIGLICGLGRSPEKGNGYSLQCSCLKNSMNRGGLQATVQRVAKSQT